MIVGSTLGRRLSFASRDRAWWVPDHFHVECAGAERRMLLRALIDEARASPAIARLLSLPVTVARSNPVIAEAWTHRNNLIVHDAVYIVLAKHLGAPVLTGDRKNGPRTLPSRPGPPHFLMRAPGPAGADEPARCGQPGYCVSVVEAEKLSPSDRRGRSVWPRSFIYCRGRLDQRLRAVQSHAAQARRR